MSKQRSETDCRKCGESTGLFVGAQTTLVGNYDTVLCPDCRNAFHLYAELHPSFVALLGIEDDVAILLARTTGDGIDRTDEIRALRQRRLDLLGELFHISQAWVVGDDQA